MFVKNAFSVSHSVVPLRRNRILTGSFSFQVSGLSSKKPYPAQLYTRKVEKFRVRSYYENYERTPGWKFMSCSYCQDLCHQASWLLIGYTRENNQSEARLNQLLTMTTQLISFRCRWSRCCTHPRGWASRPSSTGSPSTFPSRTRCSAPTGRPGARGRSS